MSHSNSSSGYEEEQITCPECGSTDVVLDQTRGEHICRECGTVVEDKLIDDGPEWRAFTAEERSKRSRVGSPTTITIHDKGLSTVIDWRDRDVHGKKLALTIFITITLSKNMIVIPPLWRLWISIMPIPSIPGTVFFVANRLLMARSRKIPFLIW